MRDAAKATGLMETEIVVADFSKPHTLPSVLEGVDSVYLTSAPDPEQVTMHRNLIRAAAQVGVRYIVRHSVRGADDNSPIKIARWHAASQRELESSGIAWTHLQPVFNMQNFLRFASSIRSHGTFVAPMRDGAISMVDARDVASVAVEALISAGHEHQTYLVPAPNPLLSLTPRSNFPMSSDDRSVISTCPPSKLARACSQRVCRSGTYRTCLGFMRSMPQGRAHM